MVEHTIPFQYTGRYYTLGQATRASEECWLVLHGYGQLAQYFLPKFELLSQKAYVIAPEGLSLFYLQGVNGSIGATWMTREFREIAIRNYIAYLTSIYQTTLANRVPQRIVLFAFSQGVSTLIRWVISNDIPFDEMILWAGDFPKDVDPERCRTVFAGKKVSYVYGNEDTFVTAERFAILQGTLTEYGLFPEIIQFSGRHEIPAEVLAKFL